jgi:hypothetical protein
MLPRAGRALGRRMAATLAVIQPDDVSRRGLSKGQQMEVPMQVSATTQTASNPQSAARSFCAGSGKS